MATAGRESGRRSRKPRVQLVPESNVPVEIAMEALEESGSDLGVAEDLLSGQSRLVRWQIRTEQLRFLTKVGLALLALIVAIVAASMVVAAMKSHEVIVQAFETPPSLTAQGINGKVVASSLQDALANIQRATRTTAKQRNIANEWTADINVEVPQTGVSIGEIDRLLRRRLGRNTYVSGDVVQTAHGTLTLTVRAQGIAARGFSGPPEKLTELARSAAEYVYGRAEPPLFATYLNQSERYKDTVDFVSDVYSDASEDRRPSLANSWGNALSSLGRNPEALEKYQLAVELDPYRWSMWGNIVGVGMQTYGEGFAYGQALKMRHAIALAPPDKKPHPADQINVNLLFQEWTDSAREQIENAKATGGGDATTTNNTVIADNEIRRHDWPSAHRYASAADKSDPTTDATRLWIAGYRELDTGHPAQAIPFLEKLDAKIRQSADVAFSFMDGSCWLGLAYGSSGRFAAAEAVFKRAGHWTSCYAFQGDTLEVQGKHAQADAAYTQAISLAPGLPFAWARWGDALLKRGDLRGAAIRFDQARRRGPRWAEPYEGLGEVFLRLGRWSQADQEFARAAEFAPNWPRLNRAWAIALSHVGRPNDAHAKLSLAQTYDPTALEGE